MNNQRHSGIRRWLSDELSNLPEFLSKLHADEAEEGIEGGEEKGRGQHKHHEGRPCNNVAYKLLPLPYTEGK